ncbi:hypothetical protein SAMN05421848_1799 [Kushneria avicenniae]|uniref:MFS transporter permease n=1 Tax=Kushneria avicenniae TaxID=402385 RepID=A0A1I1JVT0_9GAMM|nr:hypothetical protein [Kushneria avicenniae]SFC52626.1 hypothetical protein SAMN05421848_1799 [Kushneria avicenniae]
MDYALNDFLMFTPEVYLRLFERTHLALEPWFWAVPVAWLVMALLLWRAPPRARRLVPVAMAAGWGLTAAIFMLQFYAPINWPVGPFAWLFALEALLLVLLALRVPPVGIGPVVLICWVAVLLALSLMTALEAGTWQALALPGVTPDMTAVTTAVLLMAWPRRWRWGLLMIPLLWCGFSVLVLWALKLWWPLIVPAAGVLIILIATFWPTSESPDNA